MLRGPGVESTRWTGAKTSSQCTFFIVGHWLGAHVRCSGGLVTKPKGEPGTKPARNIRGNSNTIVYQRFLQNQTPWRTAAVIAKAFPWYTYVYNQRYWRRERGCSHPHLIADLLYRWCTTVHLMTYLWNPSNITWLKGVMEQIHVFHLLFAFL